MGPGIFQQSHKLPPPGPGQGGKGMAKMWRRWNLTSRLRSGHQTTVLQWSGRDVGDVGPEAHTVWERFSLRQRTSNYKYKRTKANGRALKGLVNRRSETCRK